ncbi:MAG: hypothetical protein WCV68_03790 [Candidatus Paceibacterota bacterium]|jgi:hypothetical protein
MEKLDSLGEDEESLDRFKRRLERNVPVPLNLRPTRLPRATFNVRRNWDEEGADLSTLKTEEKVPGGRWLNRFFIGTLIFFLATLAVAFWVLFYSTNIVSASNIDLEVKGPTQLRSGEELNLETTVRNRNKVTLRDVSLTITYPAGTVDSLETIKDLPLWREPIVDLDPGQSAIVGSRAVIYGAQNSTQKIVLKIEYHIPDSNAIFTKELEYQVLIGSGTIDLSYDLPAETNSGKTFSSDLRLSSNSKSVLRQVALKIEYPAGFDFQSADPSPTAGEQVWYLGDLAPGSVRDIKIVGSLSGQSEELKSFKVIVGLDKTGGTGDISSEYGNLFKTVNLKKDFISVGLNLSGKTSLTPGESLDGGINWANNLPDKVIDGSLELFLSGGSLDKRTVDSSNGFYNSLTNSILWDKTTIPDLGLINPGDKGLSSFSFKVLPASQFSGGNIPPIGLRLVFKGTRVSSDQLSEDIVSETEKSLKIGTLVQFASVGTYFVGPFKNTGPLPPKVGEETTYTITWSITNPTNSVKQARVMGNLPNYVKWLSSVAPLDEKVRYDKTNNKVVWDLGTIEPGATSGLPSRQASFQLSIVPSLSQVGELVDLIKTISFEGIDSVTGAKTVLSVPVVDTRLSTDPSFSYGQEKVVE